MRVHGRPYWLPAIGRILGLWAVVLALAGQVALGAVVPGAAVPGAVAADATASQLHLVICHAGDSGDHGKAPAPHGFACVTCPACLSVAQVAIAAPPAPDIGFAPAALPRRIGLIAAARAPPVHTGSPAYKTGPPLLS